MARRRGSSPKRDRGAALVMVLWGAVVMSIIAAAAARQASTTAMVVNVGAELTRARALADGGVRAGWSAFADGRINDLDVSWVCGSGEDLLFVKLRPETARVDINVASPDLLAALFEAAGADRQLAERIAQAAVDYRTAGEAIDDDAIEAPAPTQDEPEPTAPGTFRPGPFATIEELGYLPGMDASLFRAIADDVTVHSRALDIDRRHASPLLRRALDQLARRGDAEDAVDVDGPTMPAFEGSLMDVRAIGVTRSGAVFVRQATIEGPFDSAGLPRMLRFVQGRLAPDEILPAVSGVPDCTQGFAAVR